MLDTMTMTKAGAGLFGALLIYLLTNWAAETIFEGPGSKHDKKKEAQAYTIETEGEEVAEAEVEEIDLGVLLAEADIAKGEKVFKKCAACHKITDGANGTGPHLFGIVGRDVSAVAGFGYSGKLKAVASVWDAETLNAFLEAPKKYAPGTKMAFNGLPKIADRVNLIAYLDSLDN